jgi:hypothetical protein
VVSKPDNKFKDFWNDRGTGEKIALSWLSIVVLGLIILGIFLITTSSAWIGWGILGILLGISVLASIVYLVEESGW